MFLSVYLDMKNLHNIYVIGITNALTESLRKFFYEYVSKLGYTVKQQAIVN